MLIEKCNKENYVTPAGVIKELNFYGKISLL